MHAIFIIASIAALIGFVFGPLAARFFVGALLSVGAVFILLLISVDIIGFSQPYPAKHAVRYMGESQVAAVRGCMARHNWDRDAQTECSK